MKMTLEEWKKLADMPVFKDGIWVDMETGIPFDRNAVPTCYREESGQYFGRRAKYTLYKKRVEIEILNTKKNVVAIGVCTPKTFEKRPKTLEEEVYWACKICSHPFP